MDLKRKRKKNRMTQSMLKSTIMLTIVCLVAASLLGGAYTLTEEKIAEQSESALKSTLKEVVPDAEEFELTEDFYTAKSDDMIVGYAAVVELNGYGGLMKILVGINTQKKVTGVRIMEHLETPGLGANADKPEFYNQFNDLGPKEVGLTQNEGKIDAITGATITSKVVVDAVKEAYKRIGVAVTADSWTGATIMSKE